MAVGVALVLVCRITSLEHTRVSALQSVGRTRPLLVGTNYNDDPENELRGGAPRESGWLSRRNWPICTHGQAREIIRDTLGELTRDSQSGGGIVFHFSGYGVQLPPNREPDEKRAIVPVDMNLITERRSDQAFVSVGGLRAHDTHLSLDLPWTSQPPEPFLHRTHPSELPVEILAVMEAASSAIQELSLLDLLALYVAPQKHHVSMADMF